MALCDKIFSAEGVFEDEDQRILGFTMRFVGCEHVSDTLPEAVFSAPENRPSPKRKGMLGSVFFSKAAILAQACSEFELLEDVPTLAACKFQHFHVSLIWI